MKKCGARILTVDQVEGLEPIHENWGLSLGDEIDENGDPPRIWHPYGQYPVSTDPGLLHFCALTLCIVWLGDRIYTQYGRLGVEGTWRDS